MRPVAVAVNKVYFTQFISTVDDARCDLQLFGKSEQLVIVHGASF